jgi:AraC-like DNA-binding protein
MRFVSHWHDDLEFVLVMQGSMRYRVNCEEYVLHSGNGIFVNSRQMHGGSAINGAECKFLCIVFHPSILCAVPQMEEKCIRPLCSNNNCSSLMLEKASGWGREAIEQLNRLDTLCKDKNSGFELGLLSVLFALVFLVFQNMNRQANEKDPDTIKHLDVLREMIGFVQKNYRLRLMLKDIASAGNICRSSCSEIFRRTLHTSPISYLADYRIERSIELLNGTTLSVTEIAFECGFCSASYYTELFHAKTGQTPTEYRKKPRGTSQGIL